MILEVNYKILNFLHNNLELRLRIIWIKITIKIKILIQTKKISIN